MGASIFGIMECGAPWASVARGDLRAVTVGLGVVEIMKEEATGEMAGMRLDHRTEGIL